MASPNYVWLGWSRLNSLRTDFTNLFRREQSAGKSSVIGALAGIHLPSGSGTCTRVPVQIKTKNDPGAGWKCTILLELAYTHDKHYPPANVSSCGKIGPWWLKETPDTIPFMEITDKSDLEEAMKAAQLAILNPQQDPAHYIPGDERRVSDKITEAFSPNRIVLEISESGQQTLSFIDLPGIIQNAADSKLVDVVSKLVKHFIRRKNTLLLCVLPMSGDPQNSAALRYIREAKAINRCIGVLTKPDLLHDSDITNIWIPLLCGQKEGFELAYDYYITKQPSNNQELSFDQARVEEEEYFNSSPHWTTDLVQFHDRCGTDRLREVLAKLLAHSHKKE